MINKDVLTRATHAASALAAAQEQINVAHSELAEQATLLHKWAVANPGVFVIPPAPSEPISSPHEAARSAGVEFDDMLVYLSMARQTLRDLFYRDKFRFECLALGVAVRMQREGQKC